jgi:Mg-chelatase subunit ChlD
MRVGVMSNRSLSSLAVAILVFLPHAPAPGDGAPPLKANLDLPFDAGGEDGEEEAAPEVVVFFGQVYEGSALVFALDESGSMTQNQRWQIQVREVTRTISELSDRAEFGIVFYGSQVSAMGTRPLPATPANKNRGRIYVASRSPRGDTCLGEGVVKALEIAQLSEAKQRIVIVTSDGHPDNCATGNSATPAEVEEILRKTVAANPGLAIRVHSVWVGTHSETNAITFMRRLADAHGGTFRQVSR